MSDLFNSFRLSQSMLILIGLSVLWSCRSSNAAFHSGIPVTAKDPVWSAENIQSFEVRIEYLRQHFHIPGLSVGIVNEKKLTWHRGFGYADLDKKTIPDENTVYQVASVTKTFGSIILMQLVEEGKVTLDDPISKYNINLGARWGSDSRIKLRHLLTHTAMGNSWNGFKPGYTFRYNGDWYQKLGKAIEKGSGQSFGTLLMQNIVRPLDLKNTVPSTDDSTNFQLSGYDKTTFLEKVARPYDWNKKNLKPVEFKYGFGPAAGIMSSVTDLATYSIAIDEKKFLSAKTWDQIFTPTLSARGKTLQYGLGWFVKYYKGVKVIWHTGWWTGYSALFVKIPSKDLSFIILANSQDLSRPFYHIISPLPMIGIFSPFHKNLNKTVLASDFADAFIDHFVK